MYVFCYGYEIVIKFDIKFVFVINLIYIVGNFVGKIWFYNFFLKVYIKLVR